MTTRTTTSAVALCAVAWAGCPAQKQPPTKPMSIEQRVAGYAAFRLEADLSRLSDKQRQMIPLLIEAADVMDGLFWMQAYGNKRELLRGIGDPDTRRYVEMNYGPWNRLQDNAPFVDGVGPKPAGANFYPPDVTSDEIEAAAAVSEERGEALRSLYTLVRRDAAGRLIVEPYHQAFKPQLEVAAQKLHEAAALAEDVGLRHYLVSRAQALLNDNYRPSDFAWMEMKNNAIDVVIGPIETYEDQLFGYKAAYEAYVLIKDTAWSARLARYAHMLPELQKGLPVPAAYKRESPGTDSDLNVYDVIYYAGDSNAGAKTIAINLPNDEEVQLKTGARRLQLKNAMRAKFEKILVPIADILIAEDQKQYVRFDAFFENTMFHEVAHGLGVKHTIDGTATVREALKDKASAIEEGKADVLGLYLVIKLHEQGELDGGELMDNYVTFLAGIFRSIRFGTSSAHGAANLLRFNFFQAEDAFSRDADSGAYRVNADKMARAVQALSEKMLRLQGDGDYQGAERFIREMGEAPAQLQADLGRISQGDVPVDLVFDQGLAVLQR